jgi:hypothetical protein
MSGLDKDVAHITLTPTQSFPQQRQRQTTNGVVVVKSNIVRVTNAIGTQQQQRGY